MSLFQGLGIGVLAARILTRNAGPSTTAAATVLSPSQCRHRAAEISARSRIHTRRHPTGSVSSDATDFHARLGGFGIRQFKRHQSSSTEEKPVTQTELTEALQKDTWVPVFRFPGIIMCSFVSKAKLFQTIASALVLPWVAYLYSTGEQPIDFVLTATGAAILAPITLIGFTRTFNRLVGVIAMTEDGKYVRFGYLNFWGTRKNHITPVVDVAPFSEVVPDPKRLEKIVKLSMYSDPKNPLYLPTRGVDIIDDQRATQLFGDISGIKRRPTGLPESKKRD